MPKLGQQLIDDVNEDTKLHLMPRQVKALANIFSETGLGDRLFYTYYRGHKAWNEREDSGYPA